MTLRPKSLVICGRGWKAIKDKWLVAVSTKQHGAKKIMCGAKKRAKWGQPEGNYHWGEKITYLTFTPDESFLVIPYVSCVREVLGEMPLNSQTKTTLPK